MAGWCDIRLKAPDGGVILVDLGIVRCGPEARPYSAILTIDTNAAGVRQKVFTAARARSGKTTMLDAAIVIEAVPVVETV